MARLILHKTCESCPEQYDAYLGNKRVGYFRLRHGQFSVSVPDAGGEIIYTAEPTGDGEFTDSERGRYLLAGVTCVLEHLDKSPNEVPYIITEDEP